MRQQPQPAAHEVGSARTSEFPKRIPQIVTLLTSEPHHAFDMKRLGEEIYHMDLFNVIASLNEGAYIASQSGRIARHVNDSFHPQRSQQLRGPCSQPRARGINHYKFRLHVDAARQEPFRSAPHRNNILDYIGLQVRSRNRRGLHSKYLVKALGQVSCKEPDACIQIKGDSSVKVPRYGLDQLTNQITIYLEKRSRTHTKRFFSHLIRKHRIADR